MRKTMPQNMKIIMRNSNSNDIIKLCAKNNDLETELKRSLNQPKELIEAYHDYHCKPILRNQNIQSFMNFIPSTVLVELIISIFLNVLSTTALDMHHSDVGKFHPLGNPYQKRLPMAE